MTDSKYFTTTKKGKGRSRNVTVHPKTTSWFLLLYNPGGEGWEAPMGCPESPGMLWLTPHPAPCSGAAPGLLWGQDTLSPAP